MFRTAPLPQDMALYLIWDSESEINKDCTILEGGMSAVDSDDRQQNSKKRSKLSSSEGSDDTEQENTVCKYR